jgi:putative membrane protein
MTRLILTAGLTCALALPGLVAAQTAKPADQTPKPSGQAPRPGEQKGATTPADRGKQPSSSELAASDRTFVTHAAHSGLAEVELGRLAADKASNADVKQFGQRMVDDHSKANDELKGLAARKSVTLPTDLDAKHKAEHARLSKLSGAAFDRAYMAAMVGDHNNAVASFQRASKTAKDPDLKAWAGKTLPTLQDHQKMAREIGSKVRGTAPGTDTKK